MITTNLLCADWKELSGYFQHPNNLSYSGAHYHDKLCAPHNAIKVPLL
jgi:hypothetical protein